MGVLFKKGHSGNPKGRPKGTDYGKQIQEALKKSGKIKGKSFIEYYVDLAYSNSRVAVALANKILPELSKLDLNDNVKRMIAEAIVNGAKKK